MAIVRIGSDDFDSIKRVYFAEAAENEGVAIEDLKCDCCGLSFGYGDYVFIWAHSWKGPRPAGTDNAGVWKAHVICMDGALPGIIADMAVALRSNRHGISNPLRDTAMFSGKKVRVNLTKDGAAALIASGRTNAVANMPFEGAFDRIAPVLRSVPPGRFATFGPIEIIG